MAEGILNHALVKEAFDMVSPHIETFLQDHANQTDMSVVVSATDVINLPDASKSFAQNCFLVTGFGDRGNWQLDYERIALSKAEKSVRTGKSSVHVEAHYFRQGETPYWGSVVLDDIVVACSGVEAHYDEMFSMWIAAAIKALCKKRLTELPKGQHFI